MTMQPANIVELVEREFGVKVAFVDSLANREVGVNAQVILAQNPRRLAFVIVNLSANNVFVAPRPDVGSDRGIFLSPSGGQLVVNWREDLILPAVEWSGIASGANSDIYVLEIEMS